MVEFGRIEEPVNCSGCSNTYCLQLIHNRSVFIDKQIVKLQEIPGICLNFNFKTIFFYITFLKIFIKLKGFTFFIFLCF